MARINLLPWRDERRQIRKREFWTTMGVIAALSALAVFGAMYFMDMQNEAQDQRNAKLQTEIDGLKKQIEAIKELEKEKAKLLTKKEIIENLQGDRSLMVHLFDQMARTLPEGVVLEGITQTAESIELKGKTQSEASVAQYMRNLEASDYLKDADLNVVKMPDPAAANAKPDVRTAGFRKAFVLKITIDRPKDPTKLPEEAAAAMEAEMANAAMPATDTATSAVEAMPTTTTSAPAASTAPANTTAPAGGAQ